MPALSSPLFPLDFSREVGSGPTRCRYALPQNFVVTTIEFDGLLWAPCLFASVTKYV
jgi:hypothetical protein